MENFEYFPAKNLEEACDLLSQYGENAKILSGGQSLVNLMKQKFVSPSYIIDIKNISHLDYIRYAEDDGLRIGGLTTHRTIEKSDLIRDKYPMLSEMELNLASTAVRNWGTVGGNLCSADPASDLAPSLIALGAKVTLTNKDQERVVLVEDFIVNTLETILKEDEILTQIHIPAEAVKGGSMYMKFSRRSNDLGIAGVATHLILHESDHERCKDIRIVLGAVNPFPQRMNNAENLIKGNKIDDAVIGKVAQVVFEDCQPTTDINGTEPYKREIERVLAQRTVKEAFARARVRLS